MTKPKNRSIPQIPKPAPKAPAPGPVAVETKPCSELTKSAIALLRESFSAKAEAIAVQAAVAEGIDTAAGWKLDLEGVWFRPKPPDDKKE